MIFVDRWRRAFQHAAKGQGRLARSAHSMSRNNAVRRDRSLPAKDSRESNSICPTRLVCPLCAAVARAARLRPDPRCCRQKRVKTFRTHKSSVLRHDTTVRPYWRARFVVPSGGSGGRYAGLKGNLQEDSIANPLLGSHFVAPLTVCAGRALRCWRCLRASRVAANASSYAPLDSPREPVLERIAPFAPAYSSLPGQNWTAWQE